MMKKLAAALLAAAMTVSISAPAFAADLPLTGLTPGPVGGYVEAVANLIGVDYELDRENTIHHLSGEWDMGDLEITDGLTVSYNNIRLPISDLLTDDSLGTGNIDDDVVLPGKTYYISLAGVVKFLEDSPLIGDETLYIGRATLLKDMGK